jgi:hypothetical protein
MRVVAEPLEALTALSPLVVPTVSAVATNALAASASAMSFFIRSPFVDV